MNKSEIISFLGSEETYEKYRQLVIEELKRQIEFMGLTTHFEGTNVYDQFADFYIQGWIHNNQRFVDEINKIRSTVFSQEKIQEYIQSNPIHPEGIPDYIVNIRFKVFFEEGDITPEEQQQLNEYDNGLQLLSEEEARTKMEKNKQVEISQIMQLFDLQHFKDALKTNQGRFFNVYTNPKDLSIGKIGLKSVLKENSGSKTSIGELPKGKEYDFDVNSEQIFIVGLPENYPHLVAYFPDKEYPEGMLRSTLIQNENNSAFIAEATAQLETLYGKYKGKVNFDILSGEVLNRIIQGHLEK